MNVYNSFFFLICLKELLKFTVRANLQYSDFEVRIALTIKYFVNVQYRHFIVVIMVRLRAVPYFLRDSKASEPRVRAKIASREETRRAREAKNKGLQTKRERRVSAREAVIARGRVVRSF